MITEVLAVGILCALWAAYGIFARRWDPEGYREPGCCGGCGEGECKRQEEEPR